ncbi:CIC11C00000005046 [Sungouiella intermedia]|uniref:CIC11C00000005046 n=1 Tax=Sungouiella intermedia TaxID=45354 RepID=A0A1L0D1U9_9ASCO|nr:CIC11C00000005046 [[Candida] intermedia]
MPLFRDENFLVVHAGSEHTLFLFGLLDSLTTPHYKIPTVVYLDASTNQYKASNPDGTYSEIRPIRGSRIVDVAAFQALLKFILQTIIASHPILTINQVPLLLIIPSLSYSRAAVELISKFVFEVLEFTAFNVLDLSIAASIGLGATGSSLVVNIGHESTQIMPVIAGTCIKYAGVRLDVGGKTINEDLANLLPQLTQDQIEALKTSSIFEVLSGHETSFYSSADLAESKTTSDDEFDVAKIVTEENGEKKLLEEEDEKVETKPNSELERNSFTDASGTKHFIGKERFQGTSRLVGALSEGIFEALQQVPDVDKRQECYDNLIFVGGTSNIAGLKQAVVIKLCENHLTKPPPSKKKSKNELTVNSAIAAYQQADESGDTSGEPNGVLQVPSSIKLVKHPEYFPEWKKPKEKGGSWADVYVLGGEIYSKQIFGANSNHGGDTFMDTDVYEEKGPQAIWDVSY